MTRVVRLGVGCAFHQWTVRAGSGGQAATLPTIHAVFHPGRGNQKLDYYQHYKTCVE